MTLLNNLKQNSVGKAANIAKKFNKLVENFWKWNTHTKAMFCYFSKTVAVFRIIQRKYTNNIHTSYFFYETTIRKHVVLKIFSVIKHFCLIKFLRMYYWKLLLSSELFQENTRIIYTLVISSKEKIFRKHEGLNNFQ